MHNLKSGGHTSECEVIQNVSEAEENITTKVKDIEIEAGKSNSRKCFHIDGLMLVAWNL